MNLTLTSRPVRCVCDSGIRTESHTSDNHEQTMATDKKSVTKQVVNVKKLREKFIYDAKTGNLIWKVHPTKEGRVACRKIANGYLGVTFEGNQYSHRMVWAFHNGRMPHSDIDHINHIKTDNRIENLREASRVQNSFNRGAPKHNTSGVKGVHFDKVNGKWVAQICVNGKTKKIGRFTDIQDAANAYRAESEKHYGEFTCT